MIKDGMGKRCQGAAARGLAKTRSVKPQMLLDQCLTRRQGAAAQRPLDAESHTDNPLRQIAPMNTTAYETSFTTRIGLKPMDTFRVNPICPALQSIVVGHLGYISWLVSEGSMPQG
jgi:hypothetical protein